VPESVPTDALLDLESLGDRSDVISKDGRSPIRFPSFVESTGKYPVIGGREVAVFSPRHQCCHQQRVKRNRFLGGFATAHDAADNRANDVQLPMLKINIVPFDSEEFTLSQTRCRCQQNQRALTKGQVSEQSFDFSGCQHVWNVPSLRSLANEADRVPVSKRMYGSAPKQEPA